MIFEYNGRNKLVFFHFLSHSSMVLRFVRIIYVYNQAAEFLSTHIDEWMRVRGLNWMAEGSCHDKQNDTNQENLMEVCYVSEDANTDDQVSVPLTVAQNIVAEYNDLGVNRLYLSYAEIDQFDDS